MSERIEELRKQAKKAFDQKQYQKAIDLCSQIIVIDPNDAEAYSNRGAAYGRKGEHDKAIDDCNKAIELNPTLADEYNNRGNVYHDKGLYDKAIDDFNKAIKLNPDFADAYYSRGNTYVHEGEYDNAIDDFSKVIELNPNDAKAYNNRGNAYGHKGEYDKAIDDFNKAIEFNPNYATAYYNRGHAYRLLDKEDEALKDFREANRLDPTIVIQEATKETRDKVQETQKRVQETQKRVQENQEEAQENQEKAQETQKKVEETQDFQSILKGLKNEFKWLARIWFCFSIVAVLFTSTVLFVLPVVATYLKLEAVNLYAIYVFSSVVTMIAIRQYTNAKQLRIEASNRLAMVKMLEWIDEERKVVYKEFIPPIITSIVYSMHKDQNTKINDLSDRVHRFVDNE